MIYHVFMLILAFSVGFCSVYVPGYLIDKGKISISTGLLIASVTMNIWGFWIGSH